MSSANKSEVETRLSIIAAHDLETDTLTRLRLLAPSRVVAAAEALHEADHMIADAYFAEDPEASFDEALNITRATRAQFVRAARSVFRLKDAAPIRHRHDGTSWWRFRDSTIALVEQQVTASTVTEVPSASDDRGSTAE